MSQPIPMTGDQIADLIVKDVRRHAHCTDFKSINRFTRSPTMKSPAQTGHADSGWIAADRTRRLAPMPYARSSLGCSASIGFLKRPLGAHSGQTSSEWAVLFRSASEKSASQSRAISGPPGRGARGSREDAAKERSFHKDPGAWIMEQLRKEKGK
jgi:hypothetical protein